MHSLSILVHYISFSLHFYLSHLASFHDQLNFGPSHSLPPTISQHYYDTCDIERLYLYVEM